MSGDIRNACILVAAVRLKSCCPLAFDTLGNTSELSFLRLANGLLWSLQSL